MLIKYTTIDKVNADALIPEKLQTGEKDKSVISNDAYAVCEFINELIYKINLAISLK